MLLPQVKNKMAKPDFLKNNRGIDDGQDLAEDYMSELYDRIIQDEIKMKVNVCPEPPAARCCCSAHASRSSLVRYTGLLQPVQWDRGHASCSDQQCKCVSNRSLSHLLDHSAGRGACRTKPKAC